MTDHVCNLPRRLDGTMPWTCPYCGQPWDDPTGEWVEVPRRLCDPGPTYVRGACRHFAADVVAVESVTGEVVAQLCTRCDMALHADWPPPDAGPTLTELNAFIDADRALHDLRHRRRPTPETT